MSTTIVRRRLSRTVPPHTDAPAALTGPAAATGPATGSPVRRVTIAALVLPLASAASVLLARGALAAGAAAVWWRPDDAVAAALMAIGALISTWYALTALALLASTLLRARLGVRHWGAPLLRTLSVGAGSITLALTAPTIAGATHLEASASDPAWAGGDELGMAWTGEEWGSSAAPAPVREHSAAHVLTTPPAHTVVVQGIPVALDTTEPPSEHDPAEVAASSSHIVSRGECLWSIAGAENPGASNAWIAGRVAQYVEANPSLAANPDLIFPGQELTIPAVQP